jgi:hypothetical protein
LLTGASGLAGAGTFAAGSFTGFAALALGSPDAALPAAFLAGAGAAFMVGCSLAFFSGLSFVMQY